MARRRLPRIYDIELEQFSVRIKSVRFGKVRELLRTLEEKADDLSLMDDIAGYLLDAIVSWTLVDEDGVLMPVDRESFDELEYGEVMELVGKWMDLLTGPGPDLGKDSSSGATSRVELPTMEAL